MRAPSWLVLLMITSLASVGGGCDKKPTNYLLHIESEITESPTQPGLHSIRVRTWDTDDTTMSVANESSCFSVGASSRPLPVTMLLVPTGATDRRFQIEVTGFSDGGCATYLLSQRAKLQFVPETSLDAYLDLTSNCVGKMCPPEQTCNEGYCLDPTTTVNVTTPDGGMRVVVDMSASGGASDMAGSDLSAADFAVPCWKTCFAAGTAVTLASGFRRPIEAITEGDAVSALQEEVRSSPVEPRAAMVTHTMQHMVAEVLVLIVEGREIVTTAEHPFAVIGRGFVSAGELRVGDPLLRSNGREARVQRIELRHGSFPVYNLEVAGDHTYFVSDLELVVHNKVLIDCAQP